MRKFTETDVSNAASWAEAHDRELSKRLTNSDDDSEVRRLIRVQRNFIATVKPMLESLAGSMPKDWD